MYAGKKISGGVLEPAVTYAMGKDILLAFLSCSGRYRKLVDGVLLLRHASGAKRVLHIIKHTPQFHIPCRLGNYITNSIQALT